ncbi:MAG: Gfo/Idh/MocA family oxidoreductase, partial [Lentisphaeria bacterium]|nr:Gfo/Idh/MocA family oxidoreductase [Lentisphaeria bacterium]
MADEKKAQIGFVGVGGMGQCAHLRNYAVNSGCDVVAIAEVKEKQREEVARRYGVTKTYATYEEMLDKEKLDGIVASQPFNRHGILIGDLAKYGLPIFTEKPL